ncbi:PREDICTED: peroxidase-like [Ceratosolen solmsi marchali]|uniref:Peroxidase-like n=1 Tax=Ceratosolen solmsi marchali TaxID=326594 RepID=A0AAJ6YWQ0_9HYME|nr:PREDICTED: peroxidase-like [Ceratosolen solmsi marchali]
MRQPTERTLLTLGKGQQGHIEFASALRRRKNRIRQFQCCVCATFIATFIMALVVTISYSASHPDIFPPEINVSQLDRAQEMSTGRLKLSGHIFAPLIPSLNQTIVMTLSESEQAAAIKAGNDAIAVRRLADSLTKPLPSPSPNSRHQYAMSTSQRADHLALVGVAELAATKKVESARSFMGKPTSFGSILDAGWAPKDVCMAYSNIKCPSYASMYRTFDGSCNHPLQLGRAFTPYSRVLPPDYADGIEIPRVSLFGNPLPSARKISLQVHPPSPSINPSFTVMLAVFGQFLDHDITATAISQGTNGSSLSCCPPSGDHPECFPVKVGPGDPVYDIAGSSCMEFVRSAPAALCTIGPRQQLNQVTAFIDGSVIYGSDVDTAKSLREFSGGRLRMQITPDKRSLLPASRNANDGCNRQTEFVRGRYCFATGDARANENLHLTTMHLLWARQHNVLANELTKLNPMWNDEKIYQESRRIVGAQLQHITYNEFLPIVLGETEISRRNLKPLSKGFKLLNNNSDVNPAIANHFASAAFRFAHTLLPGLMKVTDKQKGTFSYIQLHKILFNPYSLYNEGGVENSVSTATSNLIQKTSTHVTSQLTKHLFQDKMVNQTLPCGLDLVSLNIQRGRDHGLPGFTKWREYCGLRKILNFEDLKEEMDVEALDEISKLYNNVDDIDLYTGALAELPKSDGLIGPTFTCLIADQFERLQVGDKYWYESANQSGSFNEDQLKELRKISLARIICETSDNITEIQAQVMRSIGPNNPIISCEDIPSVSLDPWKIETTNFTESRGEIPREFWLSFKNEINKTISDVISKIMIKKSSSGSDSFDWTTFENDINITFIDLKNKFTAFYPQLFKSISSVKNITASAGFN